MAPSPSLVFGVGTMAIYRSLQTHAFEPELDAMARAYEEMLRRLRLTDRTDPPDRCAEGR
jgi:hypothetical protein